MALQINNINIGGGCICLCALKFKERKDEECLNHLPNWEVWMQRRKKIHEMLGSRLRRKHGNLLMNSGDNYRNIREEKMILEYTKIQTHFDKYRGNPDFWKLPVSLKSHQPPYKDTEYCAFKSKAEKNEIPDIEYVGVPDVILKEKDLLPRTRCLKDLWHKSSYREQVVEHVSEKLLEIAPHKPDMSNLIIRGTNILPPIRKSVKSNSKDSDFNTANKMNAPEIINDSIETLVEDQSETSVLNSFKRISLKINRREINGPEFSQNETKITIMFEYFTDSTVACQQKIRFENTGQVTLRLYWSQYKKMRIFREYTDTTRIFHPFKFDKNELLLLPGTKKEFPIYFQVENPGNYFEYWEIHSRPNIWKSNYRLIILLKGFAAVRNDEERIQQLSKKLDQGVRNTTIKDLMNDVIVGGTYCAPSIAYSFNFSEQELFESVNLIRNIGVQTPKYIYNPILIGELKTFYKKIKFPEDPEHWNLSVRKLNEMARKKDIYSYFESTLELYKKAKFKRMALLLNDVDTQQSKTNKTNALPKKQLDKVNKAPTQEPKETPSEKSCFSELNDILRKLEKPSIYINKERKKFLFSYIVLRTLFWQTFDKLDESNKYLYEPVKEPQEAEEDEVVTKVKQNSQALSLPDRLLYETFDECYILRTKRMPYLSGGCNAKTKSILLKGVSSSDVKKVFKMYFNKDETKQRGTKGNTTMKEDKKSVASKGQKNKVQSDKQEDNMFLYVIEDFDPFSKEGICNYVPTERRSIPDFHPPIINKTNEDNYMMVYVTLCNAIEVLVDTIESVNERSISSDTLGELQRCHVAGHQILPSDKVSLGTVHSNITEKSSQQALSITQSQTDYFEFLQDIHWHSNLNTQKYFLAEGQKSATHIDGERMQKVTDDNEIKIKESVFNIFSISDFQRKTEPYCLKEKEVQTDLFEEDSAEEQTVQEVDSVRSSIKSSHSSKNIFYFLGE